MKVDRHEVGDNHIRSIEHLSEDDIIRLGDHYVRVTNAQ